MCQYYDACVDYYTLKYVVCCSNRKWFWRMRKRQSKPTCLMEIHWLHRSWIWLSHHTGNKSHTCSCIWTYNTLSSRPVCSNINCQPRILRCSFTWPFSIFKIYRFYFGGLPPPSRWGAVPVGETAFPWRCGHDGGGCHRRPEASVSEILGELAGAPQPPGRTAGPPTRSAQEEQGERATTQENIHSAHFFIRIVLHCV